MHQRAWGGGKGQRSWKDIPGTYWRGRDVHSITYEMMNKANKRENLIIIGGEKIIKYHRKTTTYPLQNLVDPLSLVVGGVDPPTQSSTRS